MSLRRFSLIPMAVTLLLSTLPAFAQVDPRTWETNLKTRIYTDVSRGLTTPQQGQIRLNEVAQIQQEHQNWLNQNGSPNGNVLSPGEISTIRSQLDEVNRERIMDIQNFGHGNLLSPGDYDYIGGGGFYQAHRQDFQHFDNHSVQNRQVDNRAVDNHQVAAGHPAFNQQQQAHPMPTAVEAPHPVIRQPQQDYHGEWGYKNHSGDHNEH